MKELKVVEDWDTIRKELSEQIACIQTFEHRLAAFKMVQNIKHQVDKLYVLDNKAKSATRMYNRKQQETVKLINDCVQDIEHLITVVLLCGE